MVVDKGNICKYGSLWTRSDEQPTLGPNQLSIEFAVSRVITPSTSDKKECTVTYCDRGTGKEVECSETFSKTDTKFMFTVDDISYQCTRSSNNESVVSCTHGIYTSNS